MKCLALGLLALNFTILNAMQELETMFGMDKKYLGSLIDTHFKVLPNSCYYLGDLKKVCLNCENFSLDKFVNNLSACKHHIFSWRVALRSQWDNQYEQCMDQLLKVILPQMKTFYCDPLLTEKKKENCKWILKKLFYTLIASNQWPSITSLFDMKIQSYFFLQILMNKMEQLKRKDPAQYNQALTISCRFLNSLQEWPQYENESQLKQKYTEEKWNKKKKDLDEEKSCFTRSIDCWYPELMGLLLVRDFPVLAKMFKENNFHNKMREKYSTLVENTFTFNQATKCLHIAEALDASAILSSMPKPGQHYHTIIPTEILSELNKFYIHAVAFDGSEMYQ